MKKSLLFLLLLMGFIIALNAVPRELVVVEIATGTWCGYCPGAAMGAHDLLANGQPVAIVKNHNGDSFANTYSNARNTYYAITGYPTALFDGLNRIAGGSATQSMYSQYLPRVTSRIAVPSHYTLSAFGAGQNNNWTITVNVAKPEDDTNTNVVLHASVTQSGIPFNWGNQTTVENVNRLMSPNQNGTPINLATGESTTVTLNFATQAAWPVEDLELVIWLQNVTTKEILQGKKYAMNELFPAEPVSTDLLLFPDTSINATNTLPLTIANANNMVVNGTITSSNPVFVPSVNTFSLQPFTLQEIEVAFNPTSAQVYEGTLTINSNFPDNPVITVMMTATAFNNTAPIVNDVLISGPPVKDQTLTGNYTYTDPEGHIEGNSILQWFRNTGGTPTPINGATANTYQVTEADLGATLTFQITPVDHYGLAGTTVISPATPTIIPLPYPQSFSAVFQLPEHVVCTWQKPQYFDSRGLTGYRVYRNGLNVQTVPNPDVLTFTDAYPGVGIHEYYICATYGMPNGISDPSPSIFVNVGVANDDEIATPEIGIKISPNPFNDITNISINGKSNHSANLEIYNVKGQLVNRFPATTDNKGTCSLSWNGLDSNGSRVDSGIYIYRWDNGNEVLSGKLILSK